MLRSVLERSRALEEVSSSAHDLKELMRDLETLVYTQGDELDVIEAHVCEVEETVGEAEGTLNDPSAKAARKRARKRPFNLLALCSVAGCVAAGPVGVVVGLKAALVVLAVGGTGVATG